MTIVEATKKWFKKWNKEHGCTNREEFWLGFLGYSIINAVFLFFARLYNTGENPIFLISMLTLIIELFFVCSLLAASARRLHDANKSAWLMLTYLIPVIGEIYMIIQLCAPSVTENNPYRDDTSKKLY